MYRSLIFFLAASLLIIGCAEIEPPTPKRLLSPWSGVPPARLGENKDSIRDRWGDPDEIRQLGTDETGLAKEEWTYRGRYPEVPVDYKFLSKTKRFIFTGESLTGFTPEAEAKEPPEE